MAATPCVSAIVIVRNGERFLRDALTSIQQQTYPAHEIIVVDGRSTDASLSIAREFAAHIIVQPDEGIANARNLGIAAAQGEYIVFLDHDDRWHVDKIAQQIAYHRDAPDAEYSITQMMFFHGDASFPTQSSQVQPSAVRVAGTPSALLARRALFERVGGFDPRYAIACDADWFTRARDAAVSMLVVPQVLTFKRLHQDNISHDIERNRREMFAVAHQSLLRQQAQRDADSACN